MSPLTLIFLSLLLFIESAFTRIIYSHHHKKILHEYERLLLRDYQTWEENHYQKVSYTLEGELCMDNCENNMCITGWDGVKKQCTEGSEPAPIYFTTRARNSGRYNKAVCLSRCGKFGYKYEWCLVDDGWYWDYCSSEPHSTKEVHVTETGDRCEGPCLFDDVSNHHRCVDVFGGLSKCKHDKTKINFVEAKSIYGDKCASACTDVRFDRDTRFHYSCYDVNRYNVYCAPPAQNGTMSFDLYKKLHPRM